MKLETIVVALIGAVLGGAVGPVVQAILAQKYANDKMIELAVEILKSDCKSAPGLVPAKPWAVSVVERFSPVQLGKDAKSALLRNPIPGFPDFVGCLPD
jgi:ABC-type phosphate/phosphonate transport system permease subunit